MLLGLAVVLAATAMVAAAPESLPLPPLAPVETGVYRAREIREGGELWRVNWVLRQRSENGRMILDLREDGTGIRDSVVPSSWTVRMTIDLWGKEPRLTSVREARDGEGRPQQIEERDFSYATGAGQVKTTDVNTGGTDLQKVRLHARAFTPELLPAALRLLPGEKDQQMRFDLITRGGYSVGMLAKVIGRERVDVPAGTFDCYKIELDPTGLFGVIADLTMYRLFMWHTVATPHFWVKYEGPLGGPGSRQIVRELVHFETGKAAHQ
jgi:hypothetical protein